jgi:hypothetical protein
VETEIAGGILLALFWLAIANVALKLGFGFINLIFDSALVRWCLLGVIVSVYYVTYNHLWPTVWANAYWLWLGPLLAVLAGAAALGVWNSLVALYRFLQWTEKLWDTFPQWTPFRRRVRPSGPPRP